MPCLFVCCQYGFHRAKGWVSFHRENGLNASGLPHPEALVNQRAWSHGFKPSGGLQFLGVALRQDSPGTVLCSLLMFKAGNFDPALCTM